MFVTVGMGPWPFDRLIGALSPLCESHDVFAQIGTSTIHPPCPHDRFLSYSEVQRRIADADIVITHGGNTVRLVQRAGKLPVAVAREAARGEMRNDHQVHYLREESANGRALVLDGDLSILAATVDAWLEVPGRMQLKISPCASTSAVTVRELLDRAMTSELAAVTSNPFRKHPTARYSWAFDQLRARTGRHLDVGIGDATFLLTLRQTSALKVVGVDPHPGYLAAARQQCPGLPLIRARDQLPFKGQIFDSVTLLDVLEHAADEETVLREVHRVLRPGGLLVLSVPGRHLFSSLDPDNAKFRMPRLHRVLYSARFGRDTYLERFVDRSNGLRGDMAWSRREHSNYHPSDLFPLLERSGFVPRQRDGAGLFWRLIQVPALFLPERLKRLLAAPILLDGRNFRRANLFVTAECAGDRSVGPGTS